MPRQRSIKILSLTAAVLACGFIAFLAVSRWRQEPAFQGRSASYWLRQIVSPTIVRRGINVSVTSGYILFAGPKSSQAMEAFNKMGTNAEPVLVAAIIARENSLASLFRRLYPRLPAAIRQRVPEPYDPLALRRAALFALQGPVRIHISPKLLPLLKEPDSGLRLAVLSVVQPEAGQIPFLLMADDDPDTNVRRAVLRCLSQLGPSASNAAPAVLKLCADSNSDVRADAAWVSWKITGQTNTAVPVLESVLGEAAGRNPAVAYHLLIMGDSTPFFVTTLINTLTNSQGGDRAITCSLLRDIGPPAVAAIPALRQALQDPEPEVRRRAEVALSRIDPAHAATHAP
jgi:HEAT repeat protein